MEEHVCVRKAEIEVLKEQMKVANNRILDIEKTHELLIEMNVTLELVASGLKNITDQTKENVNKIDSNKDEINKIKQGPADTFKMYRIAFATAIIGSIAGILVGRII